MSISSRAEWRTTALTKGHSQSGYGFPKGISKPEGYLKEKGTTCSWDLHYFSKFSTTELTFLVYFHVHDLFVFSVLLLNQFQL